MKNCLEAVYPKEKALLVQKLEGLYGILKKYNCYIAGGAITSIFTGAEINDIDVYFKNKKELFSCLVQEDSFNYILHVSKKAITVNFSDIPVQFIFMNYYTKAENIFKDFDFTVCMGAFDLQKDKFILHNDFFKDLAKKQLIFNPKTAFPLISCLRVKKYIDKGYRINNVELIKIILTINDLSIKTYEELEQQLGGMYGEDIMSNIDKSKPFNLKNIIEQLDEIDYINSEPKRVNSFMKKIIAIDNEYLRYATLLEYKIPYINFNDKKYMVLNEKECKFKEIEDYGFEENEDIFYHLEKCKLPNKFILYKFVKRVDQKYVSFYDNCFEYKIGDTIYPTSYGNGFLYCTELEGLKHSNYYAESNKALLKCEVDLKDIESIEFETTIRVKALKVLNIIDMKDETLFEEMEEWI